MKKFLARSILIFLCLGAAAAVLLAQSDYIHLNKVAAKLEQNRLVTGIWVQSVNLSTAIGIIEYNGYPAAEEALTKPMIDFILIEMEHEPFDMTELRSFLLGLNSKREVALKQNLQPNLAVFVRIPAEGREPVHAMIKQVLDLGAHGVVVPHVQTPEEAQKVVEACRYAQAKDSPYPIPAGTRGASPWVCAFLWGLSMPEYIKRADVWPLNPEGDIMAVVMIEDTVGLGNADAILKVPGIGALMYGPYDFSFASGHFGDTTAPVVVETWKTLKKACDKANVPLIGFADPSNVEELVRENYRMLLIGTNIDLAGGPGKVLEILRKKKF